MTKRDQACPSNPIIQPQGRRAGARIGRGGGGVAPGSVGGGQSFMSYSMSDLLQLVVAEGAADLHLRVGVPPVIRLHGVLHRVEGPPIKPEIGRASWRE